MSKKSEFEVYTDANRESDVFTFSEAKNEKQFLNENFVFKDEDNASQTSYDTNASQYGNEDNISGESSYIEDNFDNSDRKDNQNSQNSSSNTSSTSTSSASTASSSAASSSAASTAASTAASGGSVLATVATTATVAVVAVVGGGEIVKQTFKEPKFFEFQDVLVVENTVSFSLIIDPENPEVDLDEPEDTDCYVEVSYKMPERYADQVEVKKFGVFESEFKDLDYDTEYCLRLYRPGLLGAEKEYLLKEESVYEYVFRTWPKGEEAVSTESIVLSETSITLTTGNEFALTSTVRPEDASNPKVYWKSSNEEVASVYNGIVYGVSAGTATITAYQGNIEATCSVTVTDGIATESIELSDSELSLYIGEEQTITANVLPENASNKDVVWSSTDPEVATVENGVITALSTGYTIISATQGNVESTCGVTVSEKVVPVRSVSFESEELTMEVGNIVELPAIITPENFTDEVKWSSSDMNVATVNGLPDDPSIGEIYATSSGDTTITVIAGEYSATCLLHVEPKCVPTESITLNYEELSLSDNEYKTLEYTVNPWNTTDEPKWSMDVEGVVEFTQIRSNECQVHAIGGGTVTVRCTSGEYYAECVITVSEKVVPVESISFAESEIELIEGREIELTANVLPENATDKTLYWQTSDTLVATVTDGVVKAVGLGEATITAYQGDLYARVSIIVVKNNVPVKSVSFEFEELTMEVGNITELAAIIAPENFTDEVKWSSSDTNVANVNGVPDYPCFGEIYAISSGDTTITVSVGEYSATCLLHVKPKQVPTQSIELNYEELSLSDNEYKTLEYTVNPWNTTDEPQWSMDVEGVVEFSQIRSNECQVHAIGGGTVTVRCTSGEYYAECVITVETVEIPVEGLAFEKESYTLLYDETLTVGVIVTPDNATQKLVFIPGDDSIISVDSKGVVTAIGIGDTTLTVKTEDGTFEAECFIFVNQRIDVSGIWISDNTISLTIGSEDENIVYLNAGVLPDNATNKEVIWSSDNESVATVTQDNKGRGVVTAVGVGEATITVSSVDGEFTDECIIYVDGPQIEHVTGVTLNEEFIELNLTDADSSTRELTATVHPESATNKVVSWRSEDESIATVDQNGLVTGVGSGETIIIVITEDGEYTAECVVYVVEPQIEPEVEPVTGVTVSPASASIAVNETQQLTATVLPENATNKVVSWSSENENVATVDQNGLVTGVGSGETTIIVITEDGEYTAECHVTVIVPEPEQEPVVNSFGMNEYTSDAGNSFPIIDFIFDDPAGVWGNQFKIRIQPDDNESAIIKDMLPAGQYMDCFNYDGAFYLPEISDNDVARILSNSCTATVILASESSFNNAIYEGALAVNNDNHTFAAPSYFYREESNPTSGDPTFYATVNLNGDFYSVYTNVRVVLTDVNSGQQFEVDINEFDTDVVTSATITLDSQAYDVSVYGYRSGGSSEVLIFSERVTDFQLH